MYSPINYYNQNSVYTRFNRFNIQNQFKSIGANNTFKPKTYNNFNNNNHINNNINNFNNININPNIRNSNQNNNNNIIKNLNENISVIVTTDEVNKIMKILKCCVCKIYKPNDDYATGFFCEIPFANSILPVLITNNHVLNKDDIKINRIIRIALMDDEKDNEKEILIAINESRITFTNEKLDVTIIEIFPKLDGINDFLEIDGKFDEIDFKQEINVLQYPKGKSSFCIGTLKEKSMEYNKEDILYSCTTSEGSSGGPILNRTNYKVIGIHKGSEGDGKSLKVGTLMEYIIPEFENSDINKSKLKLKDREKGAKINCLNNDEIYIGSLKNGKIAIFYSDKKLKYEGDIVDGKYEGKGAYYYNDEGGNLYVGEWKKGLKHGKGILYYNHDAKKIKYEGNFSKGKFEGKGIYYWKDGSYYIGDFVNGSKHGYGTYYVKGGKIKYEGGFANDKFEGNGIYYCNNGNYYIGRFKDGLKFGKGMLANKNGEIINGKFAKNKKKEIN